MATRGGPAGANFPGVSSTTLPDSVRASIENSKAEYRRLGKSGLKVSVPILGAMSYGNPKWLDWVLAEEKVCCCYGRRVRYRINKADPNHEAAGVASVEGCI